MFTLNCKGKILSLERPLVMGILNATPDSFYSRSRTADNDSIVRLAETMVASGADILDIGGQSTRPGSERISPEEELARVIPAIQSVHERFPALIISVDTYYARVAQAAVDAGASMVNDIGGGEMDRAMIPAVANMAVPYICMHMKGTPAHMQQAPVYYNVVEEVLGFFVNKTDECTRAGIHDVVVDPGFGFGKTAEHNFALLRNLSAFKILKRPLLAGLSRKGTICNTLGVTVEEALNGTTVMNTLAVHNGAHIIRVHDVREAREVITLMQAYHSL